MGPRPPAPAARSARTAAQTPAAGTDAFDAGPGPKRQRLEGPPGGGHAHDVQPLGAAPSAEDTLALALQQHHQQQAELAAAAAAAAAAQHIQQYGDGAEAGGVALAGLQHAGHGHGHHAPGGDGELSNVMLAQQQLMAAQMQQEQALMAHMQHMQEHLHIQEQDMQYITAAAAAQGLIPPHLHYGHLAAVGEDPTAAAAGGTDDPAATAAAAASAAAALEQQAQHQLAAQQAEQGGQVAAQQLPLQLTAAGGCRMAGRGWPPRALHWPRRLGACLLACGCLRGRACIASPAATAAAVALHASLLP